VVVLDLGLPDIDGVDMLKMIRSISDVPVIVVAARDDEPTIVRALDLGADEYVTKPFSGDQLDARIRAVLSRGRARAPDAVTVGALTVDLAAHEATLDGRRRASSGGASPASTPPSGSARSSPSRSPAPASSRLDASTPGSRCGGRPSSASSRGR
jgi:DNA-binding NarL/FixJ family response regulator